MAAFFIAWPNNIQGYAHVRRPMSHFDFVGSTLLLAACILFIFGLEQGGTGVYVWNDSPVVATLTVGCICWPALFAWEWSLSKTKEDTIASIFLTRLLQNRIMAAAIL